MKKTNLAACLCAAGLWIAVPAAIGQEQQPQSQPGQSTYPNQQSDESGRRGQTRESKSSYSSNSDQQFLVKAAEGDLAEIQLGKLAQQNGTSDATKQFGQQLVTDHQKSLDQIKSIADSKGITLPSQASSKGQSEYDKLSKLSGNEFDTAFNKYVAREHMKDISEFRREAEKGKDAEIKSYAQQSLPVLQQHHEMAQSAEAQSTGGRRSNPRTDEKAPDRSQKQPDQSQPREQQQRPPQQH